MFQYLLDEVPFDKYKSPTVKGASFTRIYWTEGFLSHSLSSGPPSNWLGEISIYFIFKNCLFTNQTKLPKHVGYNLNLLLLPSSKNAYDSISVTFSIITGLADINFPS